MSIVDKVLDIIENDLNIKISKKKKQIIYDKFYPDIKDKIYWSYRIENSFYEGIISKEEYELLELQEDLKTIFKIKKNNYIRDLDNEEIEEIKYYKSLFKKISNEPENIDL